LEIELLVPSLLLGHKHDPLELVDGAVTVAIYPRRLFSSGVERIGVVSEVNGDRVIGDVSELVNGLHVIHRVHSLVV
jgi:hypothetical protein